MGRLRKILVVLLCVASISAPLVVLWQRQNILDWWVLRSYQAPSEIVGLADNTAMTEHARRLFYVHRPTLDDKKSFGEHCDAREESIVLGCYHSREAIYIYDIRDPRLSGIREVTAAHEMLHAAYDRLDEKERVEIDTLLTNFYDTLQNPRIRKNIEDYRKGDPSVVANELHSILATEVRELTPQLEVYFSQYFSDRSRVVAYSENYEKVFSDLQAQAETLKLEIDALKAQIHDDEATMAALDAELAQDRAQLDTYLAANQVEQYNAAIPGYNRKVNTYNGILNRYRERVARHNVLIEQYNQIAFEEQALVEAIDSRPKTEN
jgi:hypothetical protein